MPFTKQKMIVYKRSTTKTTIFDVAKYLLTKETMTHKKLQKLCYYAYVRYLVLYNTRLFTNHFEAWIQGVVDPHLYAKYKKYGWISIPQYTNEVNLAPSIKRCIDEVYETYGHFTGDQLGRLNCIQDPWLLARGDTPRSHPSHNRIKDQDILTFYTKMPKWSV